MNTWKFIKLEKELEQNQHNQSLIQSINNLNINNDDISVSYVLKPLMETLSWVDNNKPMIKYRFDNQHSIYVNNIKLIIENYVFNHQENEEWIESQKNVFLNLDTNPISGLYPEVWKNKETIRNYCDGVFSSGKIINNDDIIYVGILTNGITNTLIFFHIDELKSKDSIYEYASTNNTNNKSLHPKLIYKTINNDVNYNPYEYRS